jgi:hypothetical protein
LGIPQGQRLCGAFFGIPFLAKQKRYVVAGLPPACNHTSTIRVATRPNRSKHRTTANKNTTKPNMLEEAHRICALAGCDFRFRTKEEIRPITLR